MRQLKHDGSIWEYMEHFSILVLEVPRMDKEDKLHNFTEGLQPWAQNKLRRQNVQDLWAALTIADGLIDRPKNLAETPGDKSTGS